MKFLFFAVGYTLFAIVLKIALQTRWTRQLHARYGGAYAYGNIFGRIGSSNYYRFIVQPREALDPAFRSDLQRVQHRSFVWDIALGAILIAAFFAWIVVRNRVGL
jgi:hypothetical protein